MSEELEEKLRDAVATVERYLAERGKSVVEKRNLNNYQLFQLALVIRKNLCLREKILPTFAPSSPLWRLLIEIYIAKHQGARLSITDAAITINVPATTTLRYISILESERLICRESDVLDKRRSWLLLTDKGISSVEKTLRKLVQDMESFI